MWCSAARVQRIVPLRVTSSTTVHWSSVISCRFAVPPRPALLISTSISPSCSAANANIACTDSSLVTSHTTRHAPELGRRLTEPALVLVGDDDARALPPGTSSRREADAGAGGGGDEHALAGEQAVALDVGRDGDAGAHGRSSKCGSRQTDCRRRSAPTDMSTRLCTRHRRARGRECRPGQSDVPAARSPRW